MMDSTGTYQKVFSPDDPALPMNYPGFMFRTLREEGHDADALLAGTGLTPSHFNDPTYRTGFWPLHRFVKNAIAESGDPHLGVRLALRFEPNYIGLPAYAAMNAARFRDALEVVNRYFFLTFPAIEFTYADIARAPKPMEAAIRVRPKLPLHDIAYFVLSSALVMCEGLCKAMLRRSRVASRAEVTIDEPNGWSAIAPLVGFPVRFGASENRLIFPIDLLDQALPGADPINHTRLIGLCAQYAAEVAFKTTVINQVIEFLERERNLGTPLAIAAAALGYSERGLRRSLERSGTSYRRVVDEARERRARDMLANTSLPVKSIAHDLGFDTPSNFARSFKRWTGATPSAFRKSRHSAGETGQN